MSTRQPKFSQDQIKGWILAVAQQTHGGHKAPLRPKYDELRPPGALTAATILKLLGYTDGLAPAWAALCKELTGLDVAPVVAPRHVVTYRKTDNTPLEKTLAAEHGRRLPYTKAIVEGSQVRYMLR